MSRREAPRAGLLEAALAGRITNAEGAEALRLTVRHFQRLKRRFETEGAAGLLASGARRALGAAPGPGGARADWRAAADDVRGLQ